MPTEKKHIASAQKQRMKIKEKSSKYVPGKVTLQVLGTGAKGAPRSLYMFSDQSRFLFNCGEGTQRLAHEHKMKLAKLEHIFITQPVWRNLGGLPGTALTIQDVGVPQITLHGPPGLNEIFVATKRFVVLKDLRIKMEECTETNTFQDNVMVVKYVPIYRTDNNGSDETETAENNKEIQAGAEQLDASTSTRSVKSRRKRHRSSSGSSENQEIYMDETDYYAHEQSGARISPDNVSLDSQQILLETKGKGTSIAYICRLQPKPGALDLNKCVKKGVPPGPLLGKLKSGESVTLSDGTVVKTQDVCEPDDPGPIFIVVDCPTQGHLDSLVRNMEFKKHQKYAQKDEDFASLIVHFSPREVVETARYQSWINDFSPSTQHIFLNESNTCMGSIAVHRIQFKLNLLSKNIFPLLGDKGSLFDSEYCEGHLNKRFKSDENNLQNGVENLQIQQCTTLTNSVNTMSAYHLRPKMGLDRSLDIRINPNEYINETLSLENFQETLQQLKEKLIERQKDLIIREYPKILFLGTGSCIPNKTRNTSGILLQLTDSQNILLDCGEGTYGQLVRFFGPDKSDKVLSEIDAVYISHLHADHHIGLVGLLQGRRKAIEHLNLRKGPVYLFAPQQILAWLTFFDKCFESIKQEYILVPNGEIMYTNTTYPEESKNDVLEKIGLSDVTTCYVKHCPNAFGVMLMTKDNCKFTYSGDTMPCDNLVEIGKDSNVLIHEATMEDELAHEAILKMHSTTTQAIDIGNKMNAKHIILTHFSQRYAKLPKFNDSFADNVSIAFDNMQIKIDELPLIPSLYEALKLMFAEHYEEMEHKTAKRQMKLERERSVSLDRKVKQN